MTDFRALCVELTDCLEKADWPHRYKAVFQQWMDIARAALAEPVPGEPTVIEISSILKAYAVIEPQMGVSRILHEKYFSNAARAVLARWGNHPANPDSST